MEITQALDSAIEIVSAAKPRALGGGAIIEKDQVLDLLNEAQQSVPEEIHRANGVLAERDALIDSAVAEAEQIREHARAEAASLVAADEVTVAAHAEARRILEAAELETQQKRAEVDAYVDGKLAAFEGSLQGTLEAVAHGRAKLAGQWQEVEVDEVQPQ